MESMNVQFSEQYDVISSAQDLPESGQPLLPEGAERKRFWSISAGASAGCRRSD